MISSHKISVHNWDIHQTYRRDRSKPPWIKVHRNLFLSPKWVQLSDAQKGQLVSIWILSADRDGSIPGDPTIIQKLCGLDSPPDLQFFISVGFMDAGNHMVTTWQPDGNQLATRVATHDVTESESESEVEVDKTPAKNRGVGVVKKAKDILEYWNSTYGRKITVTGKIEARLKQGATVEDCKLVIDFKTKAWAGTDVQKNLQPATLFAPSHFDDYLGEAREGWDKCGAERKIQDDFIEFAETDEERKLALGAHRKATK